MAGKSPNQLDLTIAERADRQFGVVARVELLSVASGDAIDQAIAKLRLRPLFAGVYAVGHTAIRREGWWLAALMACGEGAALGGRSAGQYWGLCRGPFFPISVYIPGARGRRHDRRRLLPRRYSLAPTETIQRGALTMTTPARTLIDLHATRPPRARRELIEHAQDIKLFDARAIRRCLELHPRQHGRKPLLDFLDLLEPRKDGTRSHLERLFLPLPSRAGMEKPLVNEEIEGRQRDFVWPDRRLVIEVDGHAFHSTRQAIRRDKARDPRTHSRPLAPRAFHLRGRGLRARNGDQRTAQAR